MKKHIRRIAVIVMVAVVAIVITKAELMTPKFRKQFAGDDHRVLTGQPYCGWYNIHGYRLGNDFREDDIATNLEWDREYDITTDLIEINISDFSDRDMSPASLNQLDTILSHYRSARHSCIIRILYDWDGKATLVEPSDIRTVIRHIDSFSPVINRYTDTVFVFQGVLLGNHAEMHGSALLTDSAMRELASHLASSLDPSIYLAVRTPAQLRYITGTKDPLSADLAYASDLNSRLGLFNDGLFGSDTDLGTYVTSADRDRQTGSMIRGTRKEENKYEAALARFVPYGGEAGGFSSYSDLPGALDEIITTHISYLSRDYSEETIDKWEKSQVKIPHTDSTCDGITAIGMYLGPRPEVISVSVRRNGFLRMDTDIAVTVKNTGSSPLYRPATAILTAGDEKIPVSVDLKALATEGSTTLHFTIPFNDLSSEGTSLSLNMTDDISGRQIILSNGGYTSRGLTLGSLSR